MIREFTHIDLRDRNSFGVGQRAARLVEFETPDDLRELFRGGIPERWYVLSGGNNILFTRDYDGVLITPVGRQITPLLDDGESVLVRAEAGVEWDDLVEWAVERGLWGIENLSLIPGKAGAAPVQNIGAYGCEAKDAIERVEMFCVETGTMLTLDGGHCGFAYRSWATGMSSARWRPGAAPRCATSARRSRQSAGRSSRTRSRRATREVSSRTPSSRLRWPSGCWHNGPTCRTTPLRRDA